MQAGIRLCQCIAAGAGRGSGVSWQPERQGAGLQGSGHANKSSKHLCNEDTPAPHKAQLQLLLQAQPSWHFLLPRDQFCHLQMRSAQGEEMHFHLTAQSQVKLKKNPKITQSRFSQVLVAACPKASKQPSQAW